MNWKKIIATVLVSILKIAGKCILFLLWGTLRLIELITQSLAQWIKTMISQNTNTPS